MQDSTIWIRAIGTVVKGGQKTQVGDKSRAEYHTRRRNGSHYQRHLLLRIIRAIERLAYFLCLVSVLTEPCRRWIGLACFEARYEGAGTINAPCYEEWVGEAP
jgi:hypothetical protein